jgi:O-antigen/teichoic acid export membrane protein
MPPLKSILQFHNRPLFIALLLVTLLLTGCQQFNPSASSHPTISVFYTGIVDAAAQPNADTVYTALKLAKAEGLIVLVDDPVNADVLVYNGVIPPTLDSATLLENGTGLVLIFGPNLSQADFESLTGIPVSLEPRDNPVSLTSIEIDDPLLSEIIWNSAPQVRQRYEVLTPLSSVQPLVVTYEDGSWVLWRDASGRMYFFDAFLSADTNSQFQEWAYFNYLVYALTVRAAGQTPLSFADYPPAPVPHTSQRNILIVIMALILVTTFVVFFLVRRYSHRHPEELERIVGDQQKFQQREASTRWEDVGFHRPLSGFLIAFSIGLFLFIPLSIYQNLVLPRYILPSAQALGIWGRVTQFFSFAWVIFDMGTSVAFIKYLSQYRVHDPKKGIQYGQFYIWWQAFSGVVQIALVIALASTVAPRSTYALYAWTVIIHALIQVPGFFLVFMYALNGFQRQDYTRLLMVFFNGVLPLLTQPLFVFFMYRWGKSYPVFGGAMGGLLGLGISAYATQLFTFLIGWWMYRRIGYNARVLFLAHFDSAIIRSSLRFGFFDMLGSLAMSFGQAVEIWITQARLVNYTEIWGNWMIAQNYVWAYTGIQPLFMDIMPAISEAISHGRKLLSQYYTVMAYKWGGIISFFLCAVLLAVADRFILGASGAEFSRAAQYVVPLLIWGVFQYPSWLNERVQIGANKPYLKAILAFGEQGVRILLVLVLLEHFQIYALAIAYFVGVLLKDFVSYYVNHRYCFPQRFYFWQSLAAPLLAGVVHFAWLRWLTGLLWHQDQITSMLIFFIGIVPSFPIYMFVYSLFGGWDHDTLAELKQAVDLTGMFRPLVWVIWAVTWLGARLSPLNGRFPISIRQDALLEAQSLTAEKVKL